MSPLEKSVSGLRIRGRLTTTTNAPKTVGKLSHLTPTFGGYLEFCKCGIKVVFTHALSTLIPITLHCSEQALH